MEESERLTSVISGDVPWHGLAMDEVVSRLGTNLGGGLESGEAGRRLARDGPNRCSERAAEREWRRFLGQFHSPLLYLLVIASVVTVLMGGWIDGAVILAVVFLNTGVGYFQERRAEQAIGALARMAVREATVRRDGRRLRIGAEDVVAGDVVLLEAGDKVPADLRLMQARSLQVDESSLTGESTSVSKAVAVLAEAAAIAERTNMVFAGTLVTHGRGEGLVCATGDRTELGRIGQMLANAGELSTPLTRKMEQFGTVALWAVLGLSLVAFLLGLWRGEAPREMFGVVVALAVGAIPEGLPAAVTITLAIGVHRMARRRVLIRRLPAVEALGSTTVICSDKTGTLTENQMTVQAVYAGGRLYEVTGSGYEPEGEYLERGRAVDVACEPGLMECLRAGLLCNETRLLRERAHWAVQGDPTEAALIVAAEKAGLVHAEVQRTWPRLDVLPFEAEQQYMATLHGGGGGVIYKKGAVERLLGRCVCALDADGRMVPLERRVVERAAERMAGRGLRVLAFARRAAVDGQSRVERHHVESGLTFLGLQGMLDPPRPEAMQAVRRCLAAGIGVKMVTGDHLLTAVSVARRLGLPGAAGRYAVTGVEVDAMADEELGEAVAGIAVFARMAPEQKLRLVRTLQARGHVVAMTGDGVNDGPALRQADIGVAMGLGGTDVAKGSADMILTDDNFASIEAAVEEGRNVFDNLLKFIVWTLPTNAGEGGVVLAAVLTGMPLPVLPVQILWINLATALLLGLTLVFEPREAGLMRRPPRPVGAPILTLPLLLRTVFVTGILVAGAFGLFVWEQRRGADVAEARTVAVNVVVVVEMFYLLNCRSLTGSVAGLGYGSNPWVLSGIAAMCAVQLFFTYAPVMNRLFHSAPMPLAAWADVLAVGLVAFWAVGAEKWISRRLRRWIRRRANTRGRREASRGGF